MRIHLEYGWISVWKTSISPSPNVGTEREGCDSEKKINIGRIDNNGIRRIGSSAHGCKHCMWLDGLLRKRNGNGIVDSANMKVFTAMVNSLRMT